MSSAGSVPDLSCRVGSVELRNPVMTASGTSGHGAELSAYFDLSRLGAVVVKSVSAAPWAGNPPPRVIPVGESMMNSVGLQNDGFESWLKDHLPALQAAGANIVLSVWGQTATAYREVAERVAAAAAGGRLGGVTAVEANISCPNIEDRSHMFSHSVEGVNASVGAAVEALGGCLPLWAKLSPNVTDLPVLAAAAADRGAEAVTLVNTLMGLSIDPLSGRARLGGGGGGVSGPALHQVAVRAVFDCRAALPCLPIVGVGGIRNGRDAAELICAGADAVQVGTATFAEPAAAARIACELSQWCAHNGVTSLDQLKGRAHDPR